MQNHTNEKPSLIQATPNNLIYSLGFLGPEGSFSHICALEVAEQLGIQNLIPHQNISAIRHSLSVDELTFALMPLENSLGGSVPESLDGFLLAPSSVTVLLEKVLKIEHCLVGFSKELSTVKEVRAHFQAFAQCDNYLKKNFPGVSLHEMTSNSAAAKSLLDLSELERSSTLAICAKEAAEFYQLPILQPLINDSPDNVTRFWLLGKTPLPSNVSNSQKLTSLAFRIPQDLPGGLMKVLATLANRKINLSKIESRPTKGRLCEYTFFIDFINPLNWPAIEETVLKEIQNNCSYLRFLGTYSVFPLGDLRFE